jgi:hypothetical protein
MGRGVIARTDDQSLGNRIISIIGKTTKRDAGALVRNCVRYGQFELIGYNGRPNPAVLSEFL